SRSTHHPYPSTGSCGTIDGCPVCQWLELHSAMYFILSHVLLTTGMRRRLKYKKRWNSAQPSTTSVLLGVGELDGRKGSYSV
ncbi:hypothetical protein P692DRAFT_20730702, partial [Suillus brevipes Sb2]